jgi:hypothetical protein
MLEKLIELCKGTHITFEISTWYSLLEGKNRIVIYGIGNNYVELYHEDVFVLIEMAIKAIEEKK